MQGLLRVICNLAKLAAQAECANRMVVSLYAVLLCEVLVSAPAVSSCPCLTSFLLVPTGHGLLIFDYLLYIVRDSLA